MTGAILKTALFVSSFLLTSSVFGGLDPARIEWFKDQKLALMMHFGLYSEVGIIESWPLSDADAYWSRIEVERDVATNGFKEAYFALNRSFNPVRFRPDEWADEAVRGGFKYVIFTTKHHDGFCLYDTKYTDYKVTDKACPYSANPNADIVNAYFNACRKRGLGIGAYFSKADWHHDDFWENRGVGHFTNRGVTYDVMTRPEKWNRFKDYFRSQVLELIENYGPLDILWLDGDWMQSNGKMDLGVKDVIAEARKINPGLIAVDRHDSGSCEDVKTPEQFVPGKADQQAWESCITMAANWGYHYDDAYKSPRELIHTLIDVVAKGGNLALNVGPMPDGRLPRPAVERMREMGAWLNKFGKAIYASRPLAPYRKGDWAFTKGKDGARYAIRLWGENTSASTLFIPQDDELRGVVAVRCLGTGSVCPVRRIDNPALGEYGMAFDLPDGFMRNAYADAFELVFR